MLTTCDRPAALKSLSRLSATPAVFCLLLITHESGSVVTSICTT